MENNLEEYRCGNCHKLFFKADIEDATIEIKCKNCKNMSLIKGGESRILAVSDQTASYKRSEAMESK
jgi:phage FluMu protein Com